MEKNKAIFMTGEVHVRVDNRLVHGQVVQFWIGHLKIKHLIVADDEIAINNSISVIYRMALPPTVELTIVPIKDLPSVINGAKSVSTMVLLKDVDQVNGILKCSSHIDKIVLGNIHFSNKRSRITNSVYLSESEMQSLAELKKHNIDVEIQTFPGETLRLVVDKRGGNHWLKP